MKKVRNIVLLALAAGASLALLAGCGSGAGSASGSAAAVGSGSAAASGAASASAEANQPELFLVKDLKVTTSADGKSDRQVTRYEYDASFNKTAKIQSSRQVESWSYDADGNVIEHVKDYSSYERTTYQFENGKCVREDLYKGSSNALSTYTLNEYDAAGNLVKATVFDAGGNQRTLIEYTYQGDRVATETHNGKLLYEFLYNADGSYTKRTYYVDLNDGSYFETVYDSSNRYVVDGDGWTHEYQLDANGKVTLETATAPAGQVRTTEYVRSADGSHVTKTVSDFLSASDSAPYQTNVTETDYESGQPVYSRQQMSDTAGVLSGEVEEHFYTYTDRAGNSYGEPDDTVIPG